MPIMAEPAVLGMNASVEPKTANLVAPEAEHVEEAIVGEDQTPAQILCYDRVVNIVEQQPQSCRFLLQIKREIAVLHLHKKLARQHQNNIDPQRNEQGLTPELNHRRERPRTASEEFFDQGNAPDSEQRWKRYGKLAQDRTGGRRD